MLKSRIRPKRQRQEWGHRTVIEMMGSGQTIMRLDLPTVIAEDAAGQYPLVQDHDRTYDPPLPAVDSIRVSMRHRKLDE